MNLVLGTVLDISLAQEQNIYLKLAWDAKVLGQGLPPSTFQHLLSEVFYAVNL
jgi:hypothetical protein